MKKDSGKLIWEDFLLGIKIKRSWWLVAFYVGIIAVGFAVLFIVRTISDPQNDELMIGSALVGGLIVGAATH